MKTKEIITREFIFYDQEINKTQIEMWVDEFKNFTPNEIFSAYLKLRSSSTRVPLPVHVKNIIFDFPTADEAWALIPKSEDDFAIWCDEMRIAFSVCRQLLEIDEVAARMAFKGSYESEVLKSKSENKRPVWTASEGFKNNNKDSTLRMAIGRGWIKEDEAAKWSYEYALQSPKYLQIEGPKETFTDEVREESIKKINDILKKITKQKIEMES